jgi:hypothetical protein
MASEQAQKNKTRRYFYASFKTTWNLTSKWSWLFEEDEIQTEPNFFCRQIFKLSRFCNRKRVLKLFPTKLEKKFHKKFGMTD